MSEIKEGDWVVTRDSHIGEGIGVGWGTYIFMKVMVLKEPRRITRDNNTIWFCIDDCSYHLSWLRKVSQDGTPADWSWLTELGWEE